MVWLVESVFRMRVRFSGCGPGPQCYEGVFTRPTAEELRGPKGGRGRCKVLFGAVRAREQGNAQPPAPTRPFGPAQMRGGTPTVLYFVFSFQFLFLIIRDLKINPNLSVNF